MSQRMIEAIIEVNQRRSVPCIKALRYALHLSLREVKDLYDYIRDRGTAKVRCTEQQFAMMLLENMLAPDWLFVVHSARRVQEEPRDYIVLGEPLV